MLLARIYDVLPLLCPGTARSVVAVARCPSSPSSPTRPSYPPSSSISISHTGQPLSPARSPPQGDFLLDQTAAFDPADAEPDPGFEFDQSLPPGFDD
ncbi:MAG TPA: hypothetical protein VE173_12045 [Longimicrobiales bacterium]|nr:hypothetical protein [Longimicrobiales bacterium]